MLDLLWMLDVCVNIRFSIGEHSVLVRVLRKFMIRSNILDFKSEIFINIKWILKMNLNM